MDWLALLKSEVTLQQWTVTFLALTAIIAVRYLLLAGFFRWLILNYAESSGAIQLTQAQPSPAIVKQEIFWSLISSFIYAAPAALVLELWLAGGSAVYADIDAYPLWYLPVSIVVYLFLQDTYFYWTHRLMHLRHLYPVFHRVHHQSKPSTVWAAFSFHPYESMLSAWFLPALLLVIPIHVGVVVFVLFYMTVCAILNHCSWETMPKWWLKSWAGRIFITAAHHDLHHKNYKCNYGLYFRFWDKLLGTDIMESQYDFLDTGEPKTSGA